VTGKGAEVGDKVGSHGRVLVTSKHGDVSGQIAISCVHIKGSRELTLGIIVQANISNDGGHDSADDERGMGMERPFD